MSSFGEIIFSGEKISKAYKAKQYLFKDIAFSVSNGESLAIKGDNGSGKSTFLKIISGLLTPNKGIVLFEYEGKALSEEKKLFNMGFSAPYVNIYEEFTILELAKIYCDLKGIQSYQVQLKFLIEDASLEKHVNKAIKSFSSGMKQRVKLILSLLGNPPLLIMDEPGTNLDASGFEFLKNCIESHLKNGGALILASNANEEISLCTKQIDLKEWQ